MTATLTQVRQGLADALATIDGLNVYAFPPGQVQVPAAVIVPADGAFLSYRATMDATHDLELTITVFVQRGQDRSQTEALDAYLADSGSQSIYAAVEASQRLGGIVDGCNVVAASNHGTFNYGEVQYLGVEFSVEVLL